MSKLYASLFFLAASCMAEEQKRLSPKKDVSRAVKNVSKLITLGLFDFYAVKLVKNNYGIEKSYATMLHRGLEAYAIRETICNRDINLASLLLASVASCAFPTVLAKTIKALIDGFEDTLDKMGLND